MEERRNKQMKGVFRHDDIDNASLASSWDLVIDEEDNEPPRKIKRAVKFQEESLNLVCDWDCCNELFFDYNEFNKHLTIHIDQYNCTSDDKSCLCYWKNCIHKAPSLALLNQHLCYHGYHTKLKNLGSNVVSRCNLPKCNQKDEFEIPTNSNGYICEWEYCKEIFTTIHDFFEHIKVHVYHNPAGPKKGDINCCWKACDANSFVSQYKLSQHLHVHTLEKCIACPTCGKLFSTRRKFCDHRKRQIPTELQSYLCSQCLKSFPTETLLKDHMGIHVNNYKCSMCDMTCPSPSVLAKHMRYRHLDEKPFECNLCDYRGVSKHNLVEHLKTHDEEKFLCKSCDFKCRTQFTMDRHNHLVHQKPWTKIYQCHHCEVNFERGGFLTKHLINEHNYHWPSGHTRFRYKKDQDNIMRLQTVRYETLDVTEEIIKSKTAEKTNDDTPKKYVMKQKGDKNRIAQFEFSEEEEAAMPEKDILITINDLDAKGNVLKCEVIRSKEIICSDMMSLTKLDSLGPNQIDGNLQNC